jgi:TorA maturation chaperone TorD
MIDKARQLIYRFLSLAISDPKSRRWPAIYDEQFQAAVVAAGELLRDEVMAGELAPGELPPRELDLARLLSFLKPTEAMLEEYQQIFGLMISKKCPPYETEYCPQTFSVYRSQQLADVAGFYRAFGVQPSQDMPERQDHLALELEFMAWLIAKQEYAFQCAEKVAACVDAQKSFFRDHLAWWVPAFALALRRRADRISGADEIASPAQSFYGALAQSLASFICIERAVLAISPPTELMIPQPTADTEAGCDECCTVSIGSAK